MEREATRGGGWSTLLVIAIVLWLLLAVSAVARASEKSTGYQVGAFLGALLVSFLFSWIVRSLFRLARRRPVNDPMWTPGLFLGAAIFSLLSAVGQAGNDA